MSLENNKAGERFQIRKPTFLSFLKYVSVIIGFMVVLAFVALFLIYPLWYLAVEQKTIYTVSAFAFIIALLLGIFLYRLFRAIRDSRADDFYAKVLRWLSLLLLFSMLALAFLIATTLFDLLGAEKPMDGLIIFSSLFMTEITVFCFLFLHKLLRAQILRFPGFILFSSLFSLNALYWGAVFFLGNLYLFAILQFSALLGFFFSRKITKIISEKKKTDAESA